MDFDSFIDKAWTDHADDPRAVAHRLSEGAALASDEAQITQLANLAHHVFGEHLGEWSKGSAFIGGLSTLPAFVRQGTSGAALRRCLASLALSRETTVDPHDASAEFAELSISDRVRVFAMAAANLAERNAARARRLFDAALALVDGANFDAADPMNRAMAVSSNNLACSLEDKKTRSDDERRLMVTAAETARRFWEAAGTWLQVQRAEYRLSMSWLKAGDVTKSREHARACLAIIEANDGAAIERFFGWEAMCLAERAAGDDAAHVQALAHALAAFTALDDADRSHCTETMNRIAR
jgi:hypothetical protein